MSPLEGRLDSILLPLTVTAGENETLAEIAARMERSDVGSVIVVREEDEIVGILTERDVVRAIADGSDPALALVGEYMTSQTTTATPNTTLLEAARTMTALGVRHLPVLSGGRPVGIVSLRDVLIELIS